MGAGACRENRVARLAANLSSTNCKEWIPSSRNPASVHWTLAFRFSSLYAIRTQNKREAKASLLFLGFDGNYGYNLQFPLGRCNQTPFYAISIIKHDLGNYCCLLYGVYRYTVFLKRMYNFICFSGSNFST